jgi:hypothetical protein
MMRLRYAPWGRLLAVLVVLILVVFYLVSR